LTNLVTWPPRVEPVPVKPLFFDVAWNYIDYPGRAREVVESVKKGGVDGVGRDESAGEAVEEAVEEEQKETPKKRGWFGFGR